MHSTFRSCPIRSHSSRRRGFLHITQMLTITIVFMGYLIAQHSAMLHICVNGEWHRLVAQKSIQEINTIPWRLFFMCKEVRYHQNPNLYFPLSNIQNLNECFPLLWISYEFVFPSSMHMITHTTWMVIHTCYGLHY